MRAQLRDADFVRTLIEEVGLVPDLRSAQLYGASKKYTVGRYHCSRMVTGVGLWQNPLQLARALVHIGSGLGTHHEHGRRY